MVLAERVQGSTPRPGYRADLTVQGPWPAVAAKASVSPALEAALKANAALAGSGLPPAAPSRASSLTLTAALLGALLGGLILNLMPCVFPVLAIKVVGFARHASDRRAHRLSGLAYTVGVVASFVALGALLLALRAAGEGLGWGFQLQSPGMVAALAALFTLIGLNLAGVFEFGSFLPSGVASLQARHPVADSFLTGVLAVAVASPCTAPFMGASLGLAVTLPAAQALEIATLGGAKALGQADQIGSLQVGKRADVVVVGQGAPGQLPVHDPVSLLVYGSQGSDVRHVFVEGDLLVEHGQLTAQTGLDVERLRAHSAEQMPVLLRRAGLR